MYRLGRVGQQEVAEKNERIKNCPSTEPWAHKLEELGQAQEEGALVVELEVPQRDQTSGGLELLESPIAVPTVKQADALEPKPD